MLKFKMFHLPKPKKFNYTPRYFDPEKERREERRKELARERGEFIPGAGISGAFRQRLKTRRSSDKTSNFRLILIIFVLLLLTYWLLW